MTMPLSRPAVSKFFGVVRRNWIVVVPIRMDRAGPSVRSTTLAGTYLVRPNALAA